MRFESMGAFVRRLASLAIAGALLASAAAAEQDVKGYTRATFDEWVKKYQDAQPTFKPGDVITQKDLDKIRPFVPPGYIEQLDFPEFRAEIGPPGDYSAQQDFKECTEQYQSQVVLEANGALKNYVCGQPFAVSKLKVEDAEKFGAHGGLELQLPLAELRPDRRRRRLDLGPLRRGYARPGRPDETAGPAGGERR